MRKLSSINLDLMEEELPVLEQELLESVKGGYEDTIWGCVFNCMEYVGRQNGINQNHQYYYENFKLFFGYDPAQPDAKNKYGVEVQDIRPFFTTIYGNYQDITNVTPDSFKGTEIMLIPSPYDASGDYHAVVPIGVENGKIIYYDPSKGTSGSISGNQVIGIFGEEDWNSGANIPNVNSSGWQSGIYDYVSGNYDPNGNYYT